MFLPSLMGFDFAKDAFVGLLDLYPNAAAAYSVRKLRAAYTGSAIRVRRSSNNDEQDIGFTALGALDTSSLTSFCGSGNGFVTRWYDQSGNARNAIQSTAINQPQIVSSGSVINVNSKPSLQFDGSNDKLEVASSTATFNFIHNGGLAQIANVVKISSSGSNGFIGNNAGASANVGFYWGQDPTYAPIFVVTKGGGGFPVIADAPQNAVSNLQYLFYNEIDADNATASNRGKLYINNGSSYNNTQTTSPSTSNASFNLQIGSMGNNILPLNGNHQELIIWNLLNTGDRTGIQSNINSYYGIY